YTKKFFEVQDGVTETNHQVLAYLFVTSKEWLDGLPGKTRDQFLKIANEVTVASNAKVADKEAMNRANVLKAGGTIRELTPAQRQVWVGTMKPVWTRFAKDIGQDVIDAAVASN
ncbi:MAG: C4-dicarboxylate ABC transporter, partial [Rhodospirillaceae bacterium]|nr:C4-dicarboxylate ABC transporter [Rhodospirillaceae bacterium]